MSTLPVEPFAFQVMAWPFERVITRFGPGAGDSKVGDGGIVKVAVNAPTSFPPVPVTVNAPGTTKFPLALSGASSPLFGTFALPLGPLIVTACPASSGAKPAIGGSLGPLRFPNTAQVFKG